MRDLKMNDSINVRNNIFLRCIHPCLRDMFYKLLTNAKITLRPVIRRENLSKLTLSDSEYTYAYRLHVPYATRMLVWDIIFNPHDLTRAPDFDFNDESFEEFVHRNDLNKYVPDWANWNIKNTGSLESVLRGFIKLFTEFQVNELYRVDTFISEEYHLSVSLYRYSPDDVEIFVDDNCTTFLIPIDLQTSKLPEYMQQVDEEGVLLNPKSDYALLAVYFHDIEGKKTSVQLNLSPRLNQFIGNAKLLNIPPYGEKSLVEYIPLITEKLQKQIDDIAFQHQFKREFVASILALRSTSILEYDAFYFKQISFLCEVKGTYILVQIKMGDKFPNEKAIVEITLMHSSVSNLQLPVESVLNYEESSERVPDKMAIHLFDQLKKYIDDQFESQVCNTTL